MASSMRIFFRQSYLSCMLVPVLNRALCTSNYNGRPQDKESSLETNPLYEKYSEKIQKFKSSDPEGFQSRLNLVHEARERKESTASEKNVQSLSDKPKPKFMTPKDSPNQKSLDSIVRVDLLRKHSTEEITEIWRDFHKAKDSICAVIPSETYTRILEKAKIFPMFLYPLPRNEGYEFFFAQFDNHTCYFTSVINYQAYQENAPALLTLTHYPDLQDEKGIVLMRGEMDSKFMTVHDAQFLANQLQLYYATDNPKRLRLLRDFNLKPREFKHMDLISQLSSSTLDLG